VIQQGAATLIIFFPLVSEVVIRQPMSPHSTTHGLSIDNPWVVE